MFSGEEVEYEAHLNRSELAEFLRKLADQVEGEGIVKLSTQDGDIAFSFNEPVEVKVKCSGPKKKLKVKLEFRQRAKLV